MLLTVSGGPVPRWATPHGADQYSYPSATDFGHFMQAVGKHYGKQVKLYSIWNEPNQPQYLRPQYVNGQLVSPAIYRSLFLAGYAGLQASGQLLRHEGADGRDLAGRRAGRGDSRRRSRSCAACCA